MIFPSDIVGMIRKILYKYRTIAKINRMYNEKYESNDIGKVFLKYGTIAFNYRAFPINRFVYTNYIYKTNKYHINKCLNIELPKKY